MFSRELGERMKISTLFYNSGTVTISLSGAILELYRDGELFKSIKLSIQKIRPKEMAALISFIDIKDLKMGVYDVYVNVSYSTGSSSKESIFNIDKIPEPIDKPVHKEAYFPFWILLIIIPIIFISSLYIYYYD